MKKSYESGVATHIGSESCGAAREGGVEALTGERAGRVFSCVSKLLRDADAVGESGRLHRAHRYRKVYQSPARSETPCTYGNTSRGNREMEGRGLAKGNLPQQDASRTPSRKNAPSALERVRQAAGKDKKSRFSTLLHHIYNLETLRMAYFRMKKEASPGVDGETWRHYGEQLERNLQDLSERLKRGAYRAKPVRRVYIPKADGRQRPLGVTALEDKIVQRAAVEVLNAIY